MALVGLFYLVFTPLSTWWTAKLTAPEVGWNEYLVLFFTMAINLTSEFLYYRFVVFRNSINTNKRAQKQREQREQKEKNEKAE